MASKRGTNTSTVYVFGDQTDDARSYLRTILHTEKDPSTEHFLQKSYSRLRAEVMDCQMGELKFASLRELLDVEFQKPYKVAIEHALTSICQFAIFLRECHWERNGGYIDSTVSSLLGLCTGALTAAAVSCCRSVAELLPVAVEVVVLSFQLGKFAAKTAGLFEMVDKSNEGAVIGGSWAVAISGLGCGRVEEYIKTVALQNPIKVFLPYVGFRSSNSITICGPPQALLNLSRHPELNMEKWVWLPINAPYHAEHLYERDSINSLLDTVRMPPASGSTVPIISSQPIGSKLIEVLGSALNAILIDGMDMNTLTTRLAWQLSKHRQNKLCIVPIASSSGPLIQQALESSGIGIKIAVTKPKLQSYPSGAPASDLRCKIAIVGSSGRFPGAAEDEEAFWDLLLQGKDVHKSVPASRWSASTHVDQSEHPRKNTSATSLGCWLEDAGSFDARFFGMSPREAEQTDPAQRLALMVTYEALEDGGIVSGTRSTQPSRVGVAIGVTSNDWMETNTAQDIDTYMIPGGNRAFIPGRINYAFKFSGPSYALDTACSSSLAAIDIACKVLWMREADTMIAGGTNIITNPDFTAGLDKGHFLSRTGNCKTFDDGADGYCRGEGVGIVILKRLEDAIQDGDSIKGVIVDVRTNHSAEADSITRPHPKAQSELFARVLDGLSPSKISYVEMHGTGTQVGDAAEMSSVSEIVAPSHGPGRRSAEQVVYVGSVKANVGHGEAVAGVTGLIKLMLMLQNDTIPPHVGIKTQLNQKFPSDLGERGFRIASAPVSWKRNGVHPRYALLNNFSAAGGNTALLLEDPPLRHVGKTAKDPRDVFAITVSAKTPSALRANAQSLHQFIRQKPFVDLPSLSYTTTARRTHHSYRFALTASSTTDLCTKLFNALGSVTQTQSSIPRPNLCFVFTGQAGHYMGMGQDLYHSNSSFRTHIDRYNGLARLLGFGSFLPVITGENAGDISSFNAEIVQLAHASLQMALVRLWVSLGVAPCSVMGHSLGHYAALNAAQVLSEADTLFIVGTRARLMQERCRPGTHSMLAVRADQTTVERFIAKSENIEIACINGPRDIVLSGKRLDISLLAQSLKGQGISSTVLDTQFAFHSSQVDCILDDFRTAIQCVNFGTAQIPILCARSEGVIPSGCILGPDHLVDHFRGRVNVVSAVEVTRLQGILDNRTCFVEIGHKATMTSILKSTLGSLCNVKPSLKRNVSCWQSMTECATWLWTAGVKVRWEEWHRDFAGQMHIMRLPRYSWDLKNYWIQYINDWSLRKGDAAHIVSNRPHLLTRTIHLVLREDITQLPGSIKLKSDLNRPELRAITHGHKVNGIPLCTPSLYAVIALNVGCYLQKMLPGIPPSAKMSVKEMVILKALVAKPKGTQWLQTVVSVDAGMLITCNFSTVDDDEGIILHHATCEIGYEPSVNEITLGEHVHDTTSAIDAVRIKQENGTAYRFNNNMVYRMVATLASFGPAYRNLQEVVLDSEAMAAVGTVKFGSMPEDEDQQSNCTSPASIDSFTQLAGFLMNANDSSDLEKECFVNHGWKSMTIYTEVTKYAEYQCFVQMQNQEASVWKGTLYVISGKTLVAIFEDIQMQGLPPRLLSHVLDSVQKSQARGSGSEPSSYRNMETRKDSMEPTLAFPSRGNGPYENVDSGLDTILAIVAEESGLEKSELHNDVDLVDLGIDSLLSLLIASRLKEDVGFDLGSGSTLFDRFKTLGQLKDAYVKSKGQSLQDNWSLEHAHKGTPQVLLPSSETRITASTAIFQNQGHDAARPVTSLILQKASTRDCTILFLFPDGSGSAASYVSLPQLSPYITVIALVSPYRHDAENMTSSLQSLLDSYITEIKRRQPTDGYTLGGWSSGGVFAFCVAQMLLDRGDTVQDIILLDSPPLKINCGLGRLSDRFYNHCRSAGVFEQIGSESGNGHRPEWLIEHFKATVNLLADYQAAPLSIPHGIVQPRVSLCWAGRCALDGTRFGRFEAEAGESHDVRFLVEARDNAGPGAWAELFPGINLRVETLQAWDHFNMMVGEGAKDLANFIASCI